MPRDNVFDHGEGEMIPQGSIAFVAQQLIQMLEVQQLACWQMLRVIVFKSRASILRNVDENKLVLVRIKRQLPCLQKSYERIVDTSSLGQSHNEGQ